MEYTVKQLSELAGVSGRTLRYYDQIDLLKPARVNESGYRIYGPQEVNRLQHILFYRELGVDLGTIRSWRRQNSTKTGFTTHHAQLLEKRKQLIC